MGEPQLTLKTRKIKSVEKQGEKDGQCNKTNDNEM